MTRYCLDAYTTKAMHAASMMAPTTCFRRDGSIASRNPKKAMMSHQTIMPMLRVILNNTRQAMTSLGDKP